MLSPASSVGLVSNLRPWFVSGCTVHKEAALAPVVQISLVRNLEKEVDGDPSTGDRQFSEILTGSEPTGLPDARRSSLRQLCLLGGFSDSLSPSHRRVTFRAAILVNAELHRQPRQMTLFCVRTQTQPWISGNYLPSLTAQPLPDDRDSCDDELAAAHPNRAACLAVFRRAEPGRAPGGDANRERHPVVGEFELIRSLNRRVIFGSR